MNAVVKPEEMLERIYRYEDELKKLPRIEFETRHYYADGLYAREIVIPAGASLTGKIHKFEQLNSMYGDLIVWTDEGIKRLTGYHVIPGKAGTKRVGIALKQTIWTTYSLNPENLKDPEALELRLVHTDRALLMKEKVHGIR